MEGSSYGGDRGVAAVARDTYGSFVAAMVEPLTALIDATHTEVRAALLGLELAAAIGFPSILMKTDCANIGKRFASREKDFSRLGSYTFTF